MAQTSKTGIIAIILASLVVVASLVVLGCVVAHKMYGHHGMDHDMGHNMGHGAHKMHHDQNSDDHMMLDEAGEGVIIADIYARANGVSAKAGAAFMVIKNFTDEDDRLIGATTDVSMKTELHTHTVDASGLTVMGPLEGGLKVPAHSGVAMKRGGHHVMMMGLKRPLNDGDVITLTLIFEKAGKITVDVPVDLKR